MITRAEADWNHLAVGQQHGFCIFPDYDTGFTALKNVVRAAAKGESKVYKPTDTLLQFFSKYAPQEDHNDPESYAREVGRKLGVNYKEFKISQLLEFILQSQPCGRAQGLGGCGRCGRVHLARPGVQRARLRLRHHPLGRAAQDRCHGGSGLSVQESVFDR